MLGSWRLWWDPKFPWDEPEHRRHQTIIPGDESRSMLVFFRKRLLKARCGSFKQGKVGPTGPEAGNQSLVVVPRSREGTSALNLKHIASNL